MTCLLTTDTIMRLLSVSSAVVLKATVRNHHWLESLDPPFALFGSFLNSSLKLSKFTFLKPSLVLHYWSERL